MATEKTVGIVLFEGFELLDVFGPAEAFGVLAELGLGTVLLVAAKAGPVASAQKLRAVADHGFADCPHLDVILVPGGMGTRHLVKDAPTLDWLRKRTVDAEAVTSVCTGAAVLAAAGLLDGKRATTNKRVFQWVAQQGPRVNWIKEARWVEDGKFATSSGVSAGIDMALAQIAHLYGQEAADQVAIGMEYDWHRDASWDPFAKVHGLVK
jgi:transcriptional regulator GlxA family with amidase domain